jgi:hypothetical protein
MGFCPIPEKEAVSGASTARQWVLYGAQIWLILANGAIKMDIFQGGRKGGFYGEIFGGEELG